MKNRIFTTLTTKFYEKSLNFLRQYFTLYTLILYSMNDMSNLMCLVD